MVGNISYDFEMKVAATEMLKNAFHTKKAHKYTTQRLNQDMTFV